jgi:hypothetical protein
MRYDISEEVTVANGYQQSILDGATFGEFIRYYFTGLVDARPESLTTRSSDKWLRDTEREYRQISRMPLARAIVYFKREAARSNAEHLKSHLVKQIAQAKKLAAYSAMLATVHSWRAPKSLAHQKKSMLACIREGIAYDCKPDKAPNPWSWEQHAEWKITFLRDGVRHMRKRNAQENQRIRESNATIRAFKKLLEKHPVPAKSAAA